MSDAKANGFALLPLVLFLSVFIGTGAYLNHHGAKMAFYQLSAPVAILPAIILSILMGRDRLALKIERFLHGSGDVNILTMCMIYLLAGAFATVAESIGGVQATVNAGLSLIPASMVLPGLFIISAFIATAMGTSMGTVAAMTPIAVGVGDRIDLSLGILVAAVVSGAMFGDNLSMISDTTIAATRTQGVELRDKFKFNLLIAAPAALFTLIILMIMGTTGQVTPTESIEWVKVIPYLLILGLAIAGVNVFVVLTAGLALAGVIGLFTVPDYSMLVFSQDIYQGFVSMNEIFILSILIGGLGELIKSQGGIRYLIQVVERITARYRAKAHHTKIGELGISALVSLADICTANNTVAILITGGIAKEIAMKNEVDPRRSASLLDIFSCVFQGIIPYGAQILLAGSIAKLSPIAIVGNMFYCFLLAGVAIIAIMTGFPKQNRLWK